MSADYVESRWETRGEPTTTAYGASNSGFNEFGHRLPPKPCRQLHGVAGRSRQPVSNHDISNLVLAYHRVTGKLPTVLRVEGTKQSTSYQGLTVPFLGFVGLDIEYNAEVTHVA